MVAIIGRNRPNWVWCEWAAHAVGAVSLGLYEDILGTEAAQLLNAAEADPDVIAAYLGVSQD